MGRWLSGDALIFAAGPRFTYRNVTHWTPWFNILVGGGVDYDLNPAVAFRVSSLEYSHTWAGALKDMAYPDSLQLTMGMVLRVGN